MDDEEGDEDEDKKEEVEEEEEEPEISECWENLWKTSLWYIFLIKF